MTSARHTPAHSNLPLPGGDRRLSEAVESAWPTAMRALLLLSGSVHPGDATLARLDDQELHMLRVALGALHTIEPTSAA
jgi:hypothetical protein